MQEGLNDEPLPYDSKRMPSCLGLPILKLRPSFLRRKEEKGEGGLGRGK